jgi:ectoine hydroxylase-related dioxygenase (phytanoyl-CoA dioxygenase family)
VCEEVAPLVGDKRGVVYQCPPTLRVVVPSGRAAGKPHRDLDYPGHERAEINFWVPLVQVSGSSALHLESAAGVGDCGPAELGPGEMLRFNGMELLHHTRANETGSTRVSFDLRVIPRSYWRNDFGGKMGDYDVEFAVPPPPLSG